MPVTLFQCFSFIERNNICNSSFAFHDMSSNEVTFCKQGLGKEVDP
jgi:hypothetical protein